MTKKKMIKMREDKICINMIQELRKNYEIDKMYWINLLIKLKPIT